MSRAKIDKLYTHLLGHHKLLLDAMRAEYERANGPVANASAFLQLVIHDPELAWIQPLTRTLVELGEPSQTPHEAAAAARVERLFGPETPDFHARHVEHLAKHSDAARSHEETSRHLADLRSR